MTLLKAEDACPISSLAELPVPVNTPPMEARQTDRLPEGDGWLFEPKWDGCAGVQTSGRANAPSSSWS